MDHSTDSSPITGSTRSRTLHPDRAAAFGSELRRARGERGLSLDQLAAAAETSAGHISRVERGERTTLGLGLLERLIEAVGADPGPLYAAAGLLPPVVEQQLADPDLVHALVDGERVPYRTLWKLRRRHLSALVETTFTPPMTGRVDVEALLQRRGYRIVELFAGASERIVLEPGVVRCVDCPPTERRLLLAHALGHLVVDGDPRCELDAAASPESSQRESEATATASFILVPTPTLAIALRDEGTSFNVWAGQTGSLLEALASRLGAPSWLVAIRAAEEGFLSEAAQMEDL